MTPSVRCARNGGEGRAPAHETAARVGAGHGHHLLTHRLTPLPPDSPPPGVPGSPGAHRPDPCSTRAPCKARHRAEASRVPWKSFPEGLCAEKRSCVASWPCSGRVWKGVVASGEGTRVRAEPRARFGAETGPRCVPRPAGTWGCGGVPRPAAGRHSPADWGAPLPELHLFQKVLPPTEMALASQFPHARPGASSQGSLVSPPASGCDLLPGTTPGSPRPRSANLKGVVLSGTVRRDWPGHIPPVTKPGLRRTQASRSSRSSRGREDLVCAACPRTPVPARHQTGSGQGQPRLPRPPRL